MSVRPVDTLTAREHEIVQAVARGMSNREIGKKFGITEETVKRHLSNVFDKMGCSSRLEMAMMYKGRIGGSILRGYVCGLCDKDILIREGTPEPVDLAIVMSDGAKGIQFGSVCPACSTRFYAAIDQLVRQCKGNAA